MTTLAQSVIRKDAYQKVTGQALYAGDILKPGTLFGCLVTSTCAHANILSVDTREAQVAPGVQAVLTGQGEEVLCGVLLQDRPALAGKKVRYFGEPVALVIAATQQQAQHAATLVKVEYQPLPLCFSISEALRPDAPLVHENAENYAHVVTDIYPQKGSNIASSYKIRKGDPQAGFKACQAVVEKRFFLPHTVHAFMETRIAEAEIGRDGQVDILTCSQAPYKVKQLIASLFQLEEGSIVVKTPLVGGGYGGKSAIQLEILAYMASRAVNGKRVRIWNTREQDMASSPSRLGLEGVVKLGADKEGKIQAAEITYYVDCGAYTDIAPNMAKAASVDCTGPYNIENLSCDSLCVYTNHDYATAFRGFVHESVTFCVERSMDLLAEKLHMDPFLFREKNVLKPGDLSPSQKEITDSNLGNPAACLEKLKQVMRWQEGSRVELPGGLIRAKGIACLWKTPNPPTDASAACVITCNSDGSLNLNTGVVEMGTAGQSQLCQMLAEKLKMDYSRIFVELPVNTRTQPEYFKTVASMTTYVMGRAVMNAADDLIAKLKRLASVSLRSPEEDIEIANEKACLRQNPKFGIGFQDLVMGLKYQDGNTFGSQLVATGSFSLNHIGELSADTGKGNVGASWTVGAQGVEIELDPREWSYRVLNAATVMDVGKVIDRDGMEGLIRGGMAMGLGLGSREETVYNVSCVNETTSLRAYKVMHMGQEPRYQVEFVETPQLDAPFGTRAYTEHGIIAIPAALANALSSAAGVELNMLPITPETIWNAVNNRKEATPS